MEVNDIIRLITLMEVDATAIKNEWYIKIKDNTLATTITDLLENIHIDWWDRLKAKISDQVNTTCIIWENLMGNDPTFPFFATLPGLVIQDNLPSESAVVLTKKAIKTGDLVSTGSLRISGLAETLQQGGHLTEYSGALGLKSWLTADVTVGSTVFRAVQRANVDAAVEYNEITTVRTNPHIVDVPSRRSTLCAQA
jgi:hypothetical protein